MDKSAESETPRLPSLNRRSLLEFLAFIEVMDLDICGSEWIGRLAALLSAGFSSGCGKCFQLRRKGGTVDGARIGSC